jgi:hypothetical protein
MSKLVVHVGPGKCGSSTIQDFFINQENPCCEKLKFIFLDAKEIVKLSESNPSEDAINYFSSLISTATTINEVTILSHEFLFSKSLAIKHICSIAQDLVDEILIIGYSRRQSSFITSSYSQWFFRSPERMSEVNNELQKNGLDPIYFSGLEKHLIASILNDFYSARQMSDDSILDWNASYGKVEQFIAPFGAKIKCGSLPNRDASKNLVEDFCEKAGLTIKHKFKHLTNVNSNVKFNGDLIEAVRMATELGLNVPNPHLDNEFLGEVSNELAATIFMDDAFLSILKQYIDAYYLASNLLFVERHSLDKSFFEINNKFTKEEIIECIKNEQIRRSKEQTVLENYKKLTGRMAELLFKLHKNQESTPPKSLLSRLRSKYSLKESYKRVKQKVSLTKN